MPRRQLKNHSPDYRESGLRRWNISSRMDLFCSARLIWNETPIYKGWTLITAVKTHRNTEEYVSIPIKRDDAWRILITRYGTYGDESGEQR